MAGRIDKIATRVGDHFRKGDVLILFECAVPRAQVAHAQAVATQAEKTYEINRRLVALKSMGQLELDVSAAEVLKAKADLDAAEAVASKCAIAAPFSGVTVEQKAREFQYTTPGQPLLDVLDDRALEVELIAPSHWLSWLKPGYPVPGQDRRDRQDLSGPGNPARRPGRPGQPVDQGDRGNQRGCAGTDGRHERPSHPDAAMR